MYKYFTILMHLKYGLIRGVVSLERDNLQAFYYPSAPEIWPDKMGDFS